MPSAVSKMIQALVKDLERAFETARLTTLSASVDRLPATLSLRDELNRLVTTHAETQSPDDADAWLARFSAMADLLLNIRERLPEVESPEDRLTLLDLSVDLETVFFRDAVSRDPQTYRMLLEKGYLMTRAAAGCGFLELWEWEEVGGILSPPRSEDQITQGRFADTADYVRRVVEWSTGMVQAVYGPVIETFSEFEPEARGFLDDRVRSSLVLPLGETAGRFSTVQAVLTEVSNQVMGVSDSGRIRGLNPGFARGELVVVRDPAADIRFEDDKIYVLPRVPADMKPVAGVATASEGNLVSHVQLLARNLDIPNAVISPEHIGELAPFSGRIIFYAVSPGGRVIMKPASAGRARHRQCRSLRCGAGFSGRENLALPGASLCGEPTCTGIKVFAQPGSGNPLRKITGSSPGSGEPPSGRGLADRITAIGVYGALNGEPIQKTIHKSDIQHNRSIAFPGYASGIVVFCEEEITVRLDRERFPKILKKPTAV